MTVLDHSAERDASIPVRTPEAARGPSDPVAAAVRLRPPERRGVEERFTATDPKRSLDLARFPRVATLLRSRRFQFLLILPNQLIFWLVIFIGVFGTKNPVLNFGTAITWFVWFCLVFVLMVVVGRGWCAMCPFGGFAEWIQRRALWQRAQRFLGLGRKVPPQVAQYGLLLSVASFLGLTYIEEYFNIAGPGSPIATSLMVLGIVTTALAFFLVFERRSFCRYVCPLSAIIGTVGAMGTVAGFRTRDRERCLSCETKDCMRGGEQGYGCPWYTWPGSADSNLTCGLCSECYKSCPSDNIGLYLQPPMTSVVAPPKRRPDVAWGIAILLGLVLFQQVNALNWYPSFDGWLNRNLHYPGYPNPVDYIGIIAVAAAALAGIAFVASRLFVRKQSVPPAAGQDFMSRTSRFRTLFLPFTYGLIPVVGADYFARQLPKFFRHATAVVPAVGHLFGHGSATSRLATFSILHTPGIVNAQLVVVALGTLGAVFVSWRISGRDLAPVSQHPMAVRVATSTFVLALGFTIALLYVLMHGAN